LNSDVAEALGLESFNINHIINCLERCSDESLNVAFGERLRMTSSLLYTLFLSFENEFDDRYTHPARKSSEKQGQLVPSKVILNLKKSNNHSNNPHASLTSSTLHRDYIKRLKRLKIWPTSTKSFVSLDDGIVLFVKQLPDAKASTVTRDYNQAILTQEQELCLDYFSSHMQLLSEDLFHRKETKPSMISSFKAFLIHHFRPLSLTSGGIQQILPEAIIHSIIIPTYKRLAQNSISLLEADTVLTRQTSAAFLAFLFHTRNKISVKNFSDIVVPVLHARDKRSMKDLFWTKPQLKVLNSGEHKTVEDHQEVCPHN
jgi:hypothetical protein